MIDFQDGRPNNNMLVSDKRMLRSKQRGIT